MIVLSKIKSNKGETIAETLVSTLIAALSMIMFAGMVMAAKNIVTESDKKVREYYDGCSKLISKTEIGSSDIGQMTLYVNANGVYYYEYDDSTNAG